MYAAFSEKNNFAVLITIIIEIMNGRRILWINSLQLKYTTTKYVCIHLESFKSFVCLG